MIARFSSAVLLNALRGGVASRMDADALVAVPSGWDTSTPDQILQDLEIWKKRVQDETGLQVDWKVCGYPALFVQCPSPLDPEPEEKPAPVGQTRRGSLLESLVNILVGYSINFVANLLIFPLFGWHISARENLTLGVIYTGISLVRSYGLRRLFNRRTVRK